MSNFSTGLTGSWYEYHRDIVWAISKEARALRVWLHISFSHLHSESRDQSLDEDWLVASQSKQEIDDASQVWETFRSEAVDMHALG